MATFDNTASNSATQRRFHFYVQVFRRAGIPIFFNKISKLFSVYDIACNICTWMTNIAMLMDIITNTGDLETSFDTLRMAAPAAMVTGIYTFLRWRVNAVARLMVLTEPFSFDDTDATNPDSVSSSMAEWIPRIRKFIGSIMTFTLIFVPAFILIRILRGAHYPLAFNAWYPYDITVSPAYELTMITQMISGYVYTNILHGFNGFYATIATMICMELENIRANILNIEQITCSAMEMSFSAQKDQQKEQSYNSEAEFDTHEAVFRLRREKLKECVRRHQYVLSYIQIMERTFNPIMAVILLLQLISMCIISFSVVTSWGNGNEMMVSMTAYFEITLCLGYYCWFGSQISDQAEKVRDAAYGCDWIGAPISLQRSVAMIITTTNKEVVLTAGKFVPLSTKTMMNMISQSLSYFMFLLEVKNKLNEPEYVDNS